MGGHLKLAESSLIWLMMSRLASNIRSFPCVCLLILMTRPEGGVAWAQSPEDSSAVDAWELELSTRYLNRFIDNGVDRNKDKPAMGTGGSLSHSIGLAFSTEGIHTIGSDRLFDQSWASISYERAVSEIMTLTLDYSHYRFSNDSLHALAALTNSVSIFADLDADPTFLTFSFDRYFGEAGASYFGISLSSESSRGRLTIIPQIHFDFVSQTVENRLLPSRRKGGRGGMKADLVGTTTVSGLSEIGLLLFLEYPLGLGFDLSCIPSFVYSPTDLSAEASRFVWSAGLDYSLDF